MTGAASDPLLTALARGHEEAFAETYDRFGAGLFRVALVMLRSREEAEDSVQDVFLGLVRAGEGLRGVTNLRAYLFGSLRHAAARRSSAARRGAASLEDVGEPATTTARLGADLAARLEQALSALPDEQREVVALKVEGGLTFAEVAAVLGISPNTAASRYRYALEKLRASLEVTS